MSEQAWWGVVLLVAIGAVGGSQIYRFSNDKNFKLTSFDYIGVGVCAFLILAAHNGWFVASSVLTAGLVAAATFAATKIGWRQLLARADTRAKRLALLAFPFFAVVALYRWVQDLDRYHWEPSLSFLLFSMASALCLLIAFTRLGDWLRNE